MIKYAYRLRILALAAFLPLLLLSFSPPLTHTHALIRATYTLDVFFLVSVVVYTYFPSISFVSIRAATKMTKKITEFFVFLLFGWNRIISNSKFYSIHKTMQHTNHQNESETNENCSFFSLLLMLRLLLVRSNLKVSKFVTLEY